MQTVIGKMRNIFQTTHKKKDGAEYKMEYIGLSMISNKLLPPENVVFPIGYSYRLFQDGDEFNWARITYEADEFDSINDALNYFNEHFVTRKEKLYNCCYFCFNSDGRPVGTATAWACELNGLKQGMLSWVVISKEYQGRGLCRPLVGLAVHKLSQEYNSAFLHTQTTSFKGIKVYLDMGFEPYVLAPI